MFTLNITTAHYTTTGKAINHTQTEKPVNSLNSSTTTPVRSEQQKQNRAKRITFGYEKNRTGP
jgi:hypothetical protein